MMLPFDPLTRRLLRRLHRIDEANAVLEGIARSIAACNYQRAAMELRSAIRCFSDIPDVQQIFRRYLMEVDNALVTISTTGTSAYDYSDHITITKDISLQED
jgi:hypothetical protein